MKIQELDNFNLKNAVKFNDTLNPALWDEHEQLKPEVREKLLQIAEDFQEYLGVDNLDLKDITLSGSNAAFSYNKHSDIDLHLVVDMPDDDVYRELFDAKRYAYNDQHDIKIKGSPVELYVQDANEPHYSQGIYSVLNDEWVDVPKRRSLEVDDSNVESKFNDIVQKITNAIESEDYDTLSNVHKRIKAMRQCGLEKNGEFGVENLTFKMLRNEGWIEKLLNARNDAKDKMLSLAEKNKKKQKTIYGFGTPELLQSDVSSEWDGVSPSTEQYLNEIDYAHSLVDLSPKDMLRIISSAKTISTFQGRDIWQMKDGENNLYMFIDEDKIDAVVWLKNNRLYAMKNYTNNKGLIFALFHYIIDIEGQKIILEPHDSLTQDGLNWIVGQIKRRGFNITDQTGNPVDSNALKKEWVSAMMGESGPTGLIIGESSRANKIRENESQSMKYDMFGIHKMAEDVTSSWDGVSDSTQQFLNEKDSESHKEVIKDFILFCKKYLKIGKLPKVTLKKDAEWSSKHKTFGHYNPNDNSLMVNLAGRNICDILRTVGHELVHCKQFESVDMPANSGETGSAAENHANSVAGILMREYGQLHPELFQMPVLAEASGYIPTAAQADDPRFEMALSCDVHPGTLGRVANAFCLNTDSQGRPQIANPDGKVSRLSESLSKILNKKLIIEDDDKLKRSINTKHKVMSGHTRVMRTDEMRKSGISVARFMSEDRAIQYQILGNKNKSKLVENHCLNIIFNDCQHYLTHTHKHRVKIHTSMNNLGSYTEAASNIVENINDGIVVSDPLIEQDINGNDTVVFTIGYPNKPKNDWFSEAFAQWKLTEDLKEFKADETISKTRYTTKDIQMMEFKDVTALRRWYQSPKSDTRNVPRHYVSKYEGIFENRPMVLESNDVFAKRKQQAAKFSEEFLSYDKSNDVEIAAGEKLALLSTVVAPSDDTSRIEISGFTTPKEIKRLIMTADDKIAAIEFSDGEQYPEKGQEISAGGINLTNTIFFADKYSADYALTATELLLWEMEGHGWKIERYISESSESDILDEAISKTNEFNNVLSIVNDSLVRTAKYIQQYFPKINENDPEEAYEAATATLSPLLEKKLLEKFGVRVIIDPELHHRGQYNNDGSMSLNEQLVSTLAKTLVDSMVNWSPEPGKYDEQGNLWIDISDFDEYEELAKDIYNTRQLAVRELIGTFIHEYVHYEQHNRIAQKNLTTKQNIPNQYRSYLQKNHQEFARAIERMASDEDWQAYLSSPQEITAHAHDLANNLILGATLGQGIDNVTPEEIPRAIAALKLTLKDASKYQSQPKYTQFNVFNRDNAKHKKVLNRFLKTVYQEVSGAVQALQSQLQSSDITNEDLVTEAQSVNQLQKPSHLWKAKVKLKQPNYIGYVEVQVAAPDARTARNMIKSLYNVQEHEIGSTTRMK
jgi:hypothetical protein